jgi:hypothetical protein
MDQRQQPTRRVKSSRSQIKASQKVYVRNMPGIKPQAADARRPKNNASSEEVEVLDNAQQPTA